jgi:ribosomal protein S12 methylthiotransferase accessory factor
MTAAAVSPAAATAQPAVSILDCWEELVDARVGIVRDVQALPVDDDEPDFFHFLSTACDTSAFANLKNFGNNGGVGTTARRAIAKALGEAVERYCSAIFDEGELLIAPYDSLDCRATPPETFALYREDQYAATDFPWRPFTRDAPVAWTTGVSLATGDEVLVPAAAVYVPYHYRLHRADTPIMQPISTGLACGSSCTAATLGALCEAVERDAFTITWQAMLSRPRVAQDTLPGEVRDLLSRYHAAGLEVEVVDITTDLACPTLLTVAIGRAATSPALAVAAASDPDPTVALTKSLEELAHTRKYAAQLMDLTPPVSLDVAAGHPAVQTQRDHLRAYCPQEALVYAEFLWASPDHCTLPPQLTFPDTGEPAVSSTPVDAVGALTARLVAAGLEPIACELTTPDVAELGLAVVRVVVPGLNPLHMGHANRALGGRRLHDVPVALGAAVAGASHQDNPYPHPFP